MKIQDAIQLYQHDCAARNLSPESIKINEYAFKALQSHSNLHDLSGLTKHVIRDFLRHKSVTTSNSTSARYYDVLAAFARWLVEEEILDTNPMQNVSKPKKPERLIQPLSLEEVDRLLSVCGKDFVGVRNRLIITMLFDTGLRASELTDLDISRINLSTNTIFVDHGKGDKQRTVPIGNAVNKMIRKYLAHRGELETDRLIVSQFGTPIDNQALRLIIVRIGQKVGIKVTTHQLRHSFAVNFLRAGGNVFALQQILGHQSLVLTRHYSNIALSDTQEQHRQFSPSDRLSSLKHTGRRKIA